MLFLRSPRPDGGIGRRARLKLVFRKECGFDSHSGYQNGRLQRCGLPFFVENFSLYGMISILDRLAIVTEGGKKQQEVSCCDHTVSIDVCRATGIVQGIPVTVLTGIGEDAGAIV